MTLARRVLSIILLCSLAMAMLPHGSLPAAQAQDIIGGPEMDASIVGSRELYPGQTVPLQIAVMNKGVLTYALGFTTPSAVSSSSGGSYSYNGSASSSSNSYTNAQYAAALGQASSLQQQYVSQATTQSGSFSYSGAPFGDVELNSGSALSCEVTTAFGMSCWLSTGSAPIELVSDPHFVVGSLAAGSVFDIPYIVRVSYNAQPGVYALPLTITYKRLTDNLDLTSAWGPTLTYNNYVEETQTVVVNVVVRQMFNLAVCDVETQNMVPGGDGIVSVKVCNLGNIDSDDAVVYLLPSGVAAPQDYSSSSSDSGIQQYDDTLLSTLSKSVQSMVVPEQSSQYLGHMGPGDQKVVDFKVSISPDAEEGDYPVCAIVSYSDQYDVQKSSNVDTFGVHVDPEMKFVTDDSPVMIKSGTTMDVKLNLTNTGPLTANDAIVRMNALDPFVVSYDTLYLGDMAPQQTINTTFGIKVKPDAVPSTYYVTLEVKYYDTNDDPHVTKIIRKAITVLPPPTLLDTLLDNWPLLLGLLAILLIGLLYAGSGYLKRGKKPPSRPELPAIKAAVPETQEESSVK